jgi:hypothetical protein
VSNNFQRGDLLPVVFIPDDQANVTLNVRGWSGDDEVLRFDVTNTGHGGQTARIAGKQDWRGTVQADFDLDVPPYNTNAGGPRIRAGQGGVIRKYVSQTAQDKYIQIPVLIAKVHYESAVESQLKYSFDVEMSVLFGDFVYPEP